MRRLQMLYENILLEVDKCCPQLLKPMGLLKEPEEAIKMIAILPEIRDIEGYLIQLMMRTKGLKQAYGFKGSDEVIEFRVVQGIVPIWRILVLQAIHELSVLAEATYLYLRFPDPASYQAVEPYPIPAELKAVMLQLNPVDILEAYISTHRDMSDLMYGMLRRYEKTPLRGYKRKPLCDMLWRWHRLPFKKMADSLRTEFIVVDFDSKDLWSEAEKLLDTFNVKHYYLLDTPHGFHLIIPVKSLRLQDWFPEDGEARKRIEKLGEKYRHENGAPMVEIKTQGLEPVAGTLYQKDYIVRIHWYP